MKNKRDENSSMPHKCTNHTERMIGEGETRMVINSISYKTFCFPRRKKNALFAGIRFFPLALSYSLCECNIWVNH